MEVSQLNSSTTSLTPARLMLLIPAQTADDAQRLLDRPADVVLDLLRRRARVLGAHGERRVGQISGISVTGRRP